MRVAILINSFRTGGAQKLVADFAVAASPRIELMLITLRDRPSPVLRAAVESAGVNLVELPADSLLNLPRFRRLLRLFASEKFDVIHTHLAYANILGSTAGVLAGTPVIATLHTTGSNADQRSAATRRLEMLCLRYLSSRVVAVGHGVALSAGGSLGSKVRVIPNGVPEPPPISAEVRNDTRSQLLGGLAGPLLIAVGRFAAPKGYEDLVDAFAILRRVNQDAVLAMVGDGRLFEAIRARVKSLGLQDSVRMLGHRDNVAQLLAAGDLFVSASHREGLPIAVLEAMMVGLPVVATDVGDMPQVVTEETGRLVPAHRPDLLAEALAELLSDPKTLLLMGQAARRRAVGQYAMDLCVERYIALYQEVLDAPRRGRRTWQPSA